MTAQEIRDPQGRIIARVDIDSSGDKTIRDKYGRVLGRYNKRTDTTTDHFGRIVARGECLTMLIGNR